MRRGTEHDDIGAKLRGLRLDVWNAIRRAAEYGQTCEEIEHRLGRLHQSVGPRIRELLDRRMIAISRQTRRTHSGYKARVYVLPTYATRY